MTATSKTSSRKKVLKPIENESDEWSEFDTIVPYVKKAAKTFQSTALLQENSRELLNAARNHLKGAIKSKQLDPFVIDIVRALTGIGKPEALLKLLYHIISIETIDKAHLLDSVEAIDHILRNGSKTKDLFLYRKDLDLPKQELSTIVIKAICVSIAASDQKHTLIHKDRINMIKYLQRATQIWMNKSDDPIPHCKNVFRALWNASTDMKDDDCLYVRQIAIQALLAHGKSNDIVRKSTFANACSNAWKAAVLYQKAKRPSQKPIDDYFRETGSLLDTIASASVSLQYIEYCTYRALYTSVDIDSSCGESYLLKDGCCHQSCEGDYSIFAATALVLARSKRLLQSNASSLGPLDVKALVEKFRRYCLENPSKTFMSESVALLKLISTVSITVTIYKVLADSQRLSNEQTRTLMDLASILCECIGPMSLQALGNRIPSDDFDRIFELFVESYLRGICAMEYALKDMEGEVDYECVNRWIEKLVSSITKLKSTKDGCFEKVSKTLLILGKQRFLGKCPQNDVVFPIIASIRTQLALSQDTGPEEITDQLSSSWNILASCYRSYERHEEASLSTASGLFYGLVELSSRVRPDQSSQPVDLTMGLLWWLSTKTRHLVNFGFLPSDSEQLSIQSLSNDILSFVEDCFRTCSPSAESSEKLRSTSPRKVADMLAGVDKENSCSELFERETNAPFTIEFLLHLVISTSFDKVPVDQHTFHVFRTMLLVEVASTIASQIHGASIEQKQSYVTFLRRIHSLTLKQIRKLFPDTDSVVSTYLYSFVSLIFSISMLRPGGIDEKSALDLKDESRSSAMSWIKDAMNLPSVEDCSDESFFYLSKALIPCTFFIRKILSFAEPEQLHVDSLRWDDCFESLNHAFEEFDTSEHVQCEVSTMGRINLATYALKVSSVMMRTGFPILSCKSASVSVAISSQLEKSIRGWILAEAYNLFVEGGTISPLSEDLPDVPRGDCHVDWYHHFAALRFMIRADAANSLDSLLSGRAIALASHIPYDESLLSYWTESSFHRFVSELDTLRGSLKSSLSSLSKCFPKAKRCLVLSRSSPSLDSPVLASSDEFRIKVEASFFQCLQRIAYYYCRLGDHRRAQKYLMTWSKIQKDVLGDTCDSSALGPKNVEDMEVLMMKYLNDTRESSIALILDSFNATSSMSSKAVQLDHAFRETIRLSFLLQHVLDQNAGIHSKTLSKTLKTLDTLHTGTIDSMNSLSSHLINEIKFVQISSYMKTLAEFSIRFQKDALRLVLDASEIEELEELSSCRLLSNTDRARAQYFIAVDSLRTARDDGALTDLWQSKETGRGGRKVTKSPHSVSNARRALEKSSRILGDDTGDLHRRVLRLLFLLSGISGDQYSPLRWLSASIGMGAQAYTLRSLFGEGGYNVDDLYEKLVDSDVDDLHLDEAMIAMDLWTHDSALDDLVEMMLQEFLPAGWNIAMMGLSPTGELLSSTIRRSSGRLEVKSSCYFSSEESSHMYEALVGPVDQIIFESQSGLQTSQNCDDDDNEKDDSTRRRKWWKRREELDRRLQEHLDDIATILSDDHKCLSEVIPFESRFSRNNLAARFDAASNDREDSSASLHTKDSNGVTILILDEDLGRIPLEGMSSLKEKVVCRMPSLAHLLVALIERKRASESDIDPSKVSYILDPERNLSNTHDRLLSFLEDINEANGQNWKHVVRETPSVEFIQKSIQETSGMLMYFGHGGGQQFISRSRLEPLVVSRDENEDCYRKAKASVFLMGCSSGRLESINLKGSEIKGYTPVHYEPDGIALSYLSVGSPCVIGNLWDVTDRDIDRFTVACLKDFFEGKGSLAECVSRNRSACKLRYIVGCAPVCYGLPVYLKDKS